MKHAIPPARRRLAGLALLVGPALLVGLARPAAAAPPRLHGPLRDIVLPGTALSPAPRGLSFAIGLTEGGAHIDTTRIEVTAPGWEHGCLVTLAAVAVRGDRLIGAIVLHNGTGAPLSGLRLDLVGLDEQYRGADSGDRPTELRRGRPPGAASPLFFGDLPGGADSAPVSFDFDSVRFAPETIRLDLRLVLSGYRLAESVTPEQDIQPSPAAGGEGQEAIAPVRAGTLFETMGFSRCACQIDTIRAQGRDSQPLRTPPIRAGAAPGGLNRLITCDVGAEDYLFVVDREFAREDSTDRPLARLTRFDREGRFVTAWGWCGRDLAAPHAFSGRLEEPEAMVALGDGRVAVRLQPRSRQRARILVFAPLEWGARSVPPR